MASVDDLWPPWSPAAAFGHGPRRGGPPRGRARAGATPSRA
jgi:hypothetical protein